MQLLDRIVAHLREKPALAHDIDGAPAGIELQAATAILLLEAAYGDETYDWSEHRTIVKGLERAFGIGKRETLALLDRAEEIRPPIVTLKDVTDVLHDRYDEGQRRAIVNLLWRVIASDHLLEEWEESFADHVARALGLDAATGRAAREAARA